MGKWGQSPTYTVSHDPQEIERSPFRVLEVEEPKQVPCKRVFWGGEEDLGPTARPVLAGKCCRSEREPG